MLNELTAGREQCTAEVTTLHFQGKTISV